MRWLMSGRWRRCGGCIATRRADRWLRWNRDRGSCQRVWRDSLGCGIARVGLRSVMLRFGIVITPRRVIVVGRPVRSMGWVSVNGATMSSLKGRVLSTGYRPGVLLAFGLPVGSIGYGPGSRRSARSVARTNGLDAGPYPMQDFGRMTEE